MDITNYLAGVNQNITNATTPKSISGSTVGNALSALATLTKTAVEGITASGDWNSISNIPTTLSGYTVSSGDTLFDKKYLSISSAATIYSIQTGLTAETTLRVNGDTFLQNQITGLTANFGSYYTTGQTDGKYVGLVGNQNIGGNKAFSGNTIFSSGVSISNSNPTLTFTNTLVGNAAYFDYSSTQNTFIFNSQVNSVGGIGSGILTNGGYLTGNDTGLLTGMVSTALTMTFSWWYKTTVNGNQNLINIGTAGLHGLCIYTTGTAVMFQVGGQAVQCGGSTYDGNWHNLIVTISGN